MLCFIRWHPASTPYFLTGSKHHDVMKGICTFKYSIVLTFFPVACSAASLTFLGFFFAQAKPSVSWWACTLFIYLASIFFAHFQRHIKSKKNKLMRFKIIWFNRESNNEQNTLRRILSDYSPQPYNAAMNWIIKSLSGRNLHVLAFRKWTPYLIILQRHTEASKIADLQAPNTVWNGTVWVCRSATLAMKTDCLGHIFGGFQSTMAIFNSNIN